MDNQLIAFIDLLNNPYYRVLFIIFLLWNILWKGVALWKSAQNNQRNWFMVMLVLNTFGILEAIYIFYFQARKSDNVSK